MLVCISAKKIKVKSSSGPGFYTVENIHTPRPTCNCKGFQYRQHCKHIKEVEGDNYCKWTGQSSSAQGICPNCGDEVVTDVDFSIVEFDDWDYSYHQSLGNTAILIDPELEPING